MRAIEAFDWVYKLSCFSIGVLFIYAGTLKLLAPHTFAVLVDAYGIIPEQMSVPVAIVLPALEVLAGIGLVLNVRGSLLAIAILLMLFVVILAYGIWMGLDVDCGCFGPQDPEAEAFHGLRRTLYRDMGLLAGISLVFGWRRYRAIEPVRLTRFIKNRFKKGEEKDAYV